MTGEGSGPAAPGAPGAGSGGEVRALPGLALGASLFLSAITLAAPGALGPLGPLAAGVLAFLGYRRIRAARGPASSRWLAAGAMTLALVLLVMQGMTMIRNAPAAAAWAQMRRRVAEIEASLRTGTAESTLELLSDPPRSILEREGFVASLRETAGKLGPLVELGEPEGVGGDWDLTANFQEDEGKHLILPMVFHARFQRGRGTVTVMFLVRRAGIAAHVDTLRIEVRPDSPPGEGAPDGDADQKSKSSTPK